MGSLRLKSAHSSFERQERSDDWKGVAKKLLLHRHAATTVIKQIKQ